MHKDIEEDDQVSRGEPQLVLRSDEGVRDGHETRVHSSTPPLGDGVNRQQVFGRRFFKHAAAVSKSTDEVKLYI